MSLDHNNDNNNKNHTKNLHFAIFYDYAGLTSVQLKNEDIKCKHLFITQKKHAHVAFFTILTTRWRKEYTLFAKNFEGRPF